MALGELIKVAVDQRPGGANHRSLWAAGQLQEHAFLKVTGSYSRRIHRLNDPKGIFELADLNEDSERKGQVVHNVDELAAQVSVVVQRSD